MNRYIQLTNNLSRGCSPLDSSIRSLRIFSLHKSILDKKTKSFVHFFVVIGYNGGDVQEECFYKIDGSNLEKSPIHISTSAGDIFYQFSYKNHNLINFEFELGQLDRQIQREFIEEINKYLLYDDGADYYFYDNRNSNIKNGFLITDKFPIKILKFLQNVYWPFSNHC